MKQILLLIVFMVSISTLKAEKPTIPIENWTEIRCEIAKKNLGMKHRSLFIQPRVFQTNNDEIAILTFEGDCDMQILVENTDGFIVSQSSQHVVAGQPCYHYIGDLKTGEYKVVIETDKYVLTGQIVKE